MKCVVKLGGSLITNAEILNCMHILSSWPGQIIIVSGGGVFADTVRSSQAQWQFNDSIAHRMAILAMQQTALLIHGLMPEASLLTSFSQLNKTEALRIWSPNVAELDQAGIPHSWDISSDSLAACLANIWNADSLILVKSAPIEESMTLQQQQLLGIVDAGFQHSIEQSNFQVKIIHHKHLAHIYDQIT